MIWFIVLVKGGDCNDCLFFYIFELIINNFF